MPLTAQAIELGRVTWCVRCVGEQQHFCGLMSQSNRLMMAVI